MYRKEAPWESAQKELLAINAYKVIYLFHFLFCMIIIVISLGKQGWHSGESTRLPPMWPGFETQMWVEFVIGSHPCSKGFSPGTPVSLPPCPQKLTFLKFQFDLETVEEKSQSWISAKIPIENIDHVPGNGLLSCTCKLLAVDIH